MRLDDSKKISLNFIFTCILATIYTISLKKSKYNKYFRTEEV